jgi:poly(3-hydroxyalkanoate) synthetase
MNLYHYWPIADEIYRVPILIVMATTNRGYILDMVPEQSFIEFLLKRGYDVYMLDWTPPRPEDGHGGWRTTFSTSFRIASAACSWIPAKPMSP